MREQIAVCEQLDVDLVIAGRHLRRQRDDGAKQRRRQETSRHSALRCRGRVRRMSRTSAARKGSRLTSPISLWISFRKRRIGDPKLKPPQGIRRWRWRRAAGSTAPQDRTADQQKYVRRYSPKCRARAVCAWCAATPAARQRWRRYRMAAIAASRCVALDRAEQYQLHAGIIRGNHHVMIGRARRSAVRPRPGPCRPGRQWQK